MYGKLFEQMYDGTLAVNWKGLVTFQQMIVLANDDGIVDMTADAMARRTGIPLKIIEEGITFLEAPDPHSRTPDRDGRRIERIDAHRPWGWVIVNHRKYRDMLRREEKKAADRARIAEKRATEKPSDFNNVATCRTVSPSVANVAHTDTDTDTELRGSPNGDLSGSASEPRRIAAGLARKEQAEAAKRVLDFLNEKTGRNYRPTAVNVEKIVARLREDYTEQQCRQVIAKKCREWMPDEKMAVYLRPATLFGREKFSQYAGELGQREVNHAAA